MTEPTTESAEDTAPVYTDFQQAEAAAAAGGHVFESTTPNGTVWTVDTRLPNAHKRVLDHLEVKTVKLNTAQRLERLRAAMGGNDG